MYFSQLACWYFIELQILNLYITAFNHNPIVDSTIENLWMTVLKLSLDVSVNHTWNDGWFTAWLYKHVAEGDQFSGL